MSDSELYTEYILTLLRDHGGNGVLLKHAITSLLDEYETLVLRRGSLYDTDKHIFELQEEEPCQNE